MSPHFPVPAIHSNTISVLNRANIPVHRRTANHHMENIAGQDGEATDRMIAGRYTRTGQPAQRGLTRNTPGTSSCGVVVRVLAPGGAHCRGWQAGPGRRILATREVDHERDGHRDPGEDAAEQDREVDREVDGRPVTS